jgi:large subunit ribosomal protein L22
MQVTSTYRYARISAFKAREVTREIQGRSASDALDLLTFSPKKAAVMVRKTLKSAIANAENNADLKVDTLLVKEAVVGEGPTFKRFRARARGSASPLRKRTSWLRRRHAAGHARPNPEKRRRSSLTTRLRQCQARHRLLASLPVERRLLKRPRLRRNVKPLSGSHRQRRRKSNLWDKKLIRSDFVSF